MEGAGSKLSATLLPNPDQGEEIMAKGQLTKKMEKKEPAKTFKEKREAKKTKKEEKKKS
jgi:hypothetical protein